MQFQKTPHLTNNTPDQTVPISVLPIFDLPFPSQSVWKFIPRIKRGEAQGPRRESKFDSRAERTDNGVPSEKAL
jgi:hypothetical protein